MISKLSITFHINFCIIYWEGIHGFIESSFISHSEVKDLWSQMFFYHAPVHTSMLVKIGDASDKINVHSNEFILFNNAEEVN